MCLNWILKRKIIRVCLDSQVDTPWLQGVNRQFGDIVVTASVNGCEANQLGVIRIPLLDHNLRRVILSAHFRVLRKVDVVLAVDSERGDRNVPFESIAELDLAG